MNKNLRLTKKPDEKYAKNFVFMKIAQKWYEFMSIHKLFIKQNLLLISK